jgi:hypothetical protein
MTIGQPDASISKQAATLCEKIVCYQVLVSDTNENKLTGVIEISPQTTRH